MKQGLKRQRDNGGKSAKGDFNQKRRDFNAKGPRIKKEFKRARNIKRPTRERPERGHWRRVGKHIYRGEEVTGVTCGKKKEWRALFTNDSGAKAIILRN